MRTWRGCRRRPARPPYCGTCGEDRLRDQGFSPPLDGPEGPAPTIAAPDVPEAPPLQACLQLQAAIKIVTLQPALTPIPNPRSPIPDPRSRPPHGRLAI